MSTEEFEKYDDLNVPSSGEEGSKDLDEYGVWIKKRPSADDESSLFATSSASEDDAVSDDFDNEVFNDDIGLSADTDTNSVDGDAFDFDGLAGDFSLSDDSLKEDVDEGKEHEMDDVDMSDFFTDFGDDSSDEDAETEDTLKMDLNFDTVDSFAEDGESVDDFDAMFNGAESVDSTVQSGALTEDVFTENNEFDDFLSADSSTSGVLRATQDDGTSHNVSLDVDVDEEQNFDKLSDESSVFIDSPIDTVEQEMEKKNGDEDDSVVIKNTVIEATNIEEIKSKNQEVLNDAKGASTGNTQKGSTSMEDFNDVDALAKDLTDGSVNVASIVHSAGVGTNVVSVEGLDQVRELLEGIAQELTSIRKELAALKNNVSSLPKYEDEASPASSNFEGKTAGHEESGFFKDEDTDEAIALTGDELNNILITADFTEETGGDGIDGEEPKERNEDEVGIEDDAKVAEGSNEKESEEILGACEVCGEDEKNVGDEDAEFDSDSFEFDDIALENSKLDDFVIPEELDYNMLRMEDDGNDSSDSEDEVPLVSDSDMAYLNEKDDSALPQTQELSVKDQDACDDDSQNANPSIDNSEGKQEIPVSIKKDIKSVLSYMDQLLESLPEEKIKEFAESEYFEMYHRLFTELGIS